MNDDSQIQTAFTLWKSIAKLEQMLWDQYYREFTQLLLDKQGQESPKDDIHDFVF